MYCDLGALMKHIVYIIIIGICLLGCSEQREYVERLEQANVLLNSNPDSALKILNSLSCYEQDFSKSFRMKFQLLKLQAQNKAFVDFTSDSIAKDLVDYYGRHGNSNEQMTANYILGCVYRDLGEAPKAVDCYLEAISKSDTLRNDCDFYTLSAVYAQMADIFHKQLLLTNEIEARNQSINFCLMAKDTILSLLYKDKIAGVYILLNKKDSAEMLLKDVQRQYKQRKNDNGALQSSTKLIYLYVQNKERLADAKRLMDDYEANYSYFKNGNELPPSKKQYYYYKGLYYENLGKLDSAEYFYRKQYSHENIRQNPETIYKGLLSIYSKRHKGDSIAKYAKLYCEVNDSSIAKKDKELIAEMAASYNYNRYQKEALNNEARANNLRFIILIICFLAVSATFIVWVKVQKSKAKRIKELNALKAEYIDATNVYNENLRLLKIIDQSKQEEILQIQKENEILKSRIEVLKNNVGIQEHIIKSRKLKESDISKRLSYLISHPTTSMSSNDWEEIVNAASMYYPDLIHDLNKNPKITQQEMRTCILLCFSLRESDIAHLLNTSAQRITNAKSTLNTKLFGDNSARTLYKHLTSSYNIYAI